MIICQRENKEPIMVASILKKYIYFTLCVYA